MADWFIATEGVKGEISVLPDEDYAQKALARPRKLYLSTGDNKQ